MTDVRTDVIASSGGTSSQTGNLTHKSIFSVGRKDKIDEVKVITTEFLEPNIYHTYTFRKPKKLLLLRQLLL